MTIGSLILTTAMIATVCGCATTSQGDLASQAKITKTEAEQTALARVPNGAIKEGELEKEKGHLIWSFDISTPGNKNITEVAVDAITGKIISVDEESPAAEAKEAKTEAKEKKSKKHDDDDEKEEKK